MTIQTVMSTAVNIKAYKGINLVDKFIDVYNSKTTKIPEGNRYLHLVLMCKALAKIENYDNKVFDTLFKDLKLIMVYNDNRTLFKQIRNELVHLNMFLEHEEHNHKTFE